MNPQLLPLSAARISTGVVSSSHDCIGKYNGAALEAQSCVVDDTHPAFINGGSVDGYILLEEADKIPVPTLNETLCVLLGGEVDTSKAPKACKRTANGLITFAGDWCSTTNAAGGCRDSVALKADFAAASVKINN